ncbi:MAG: hypothetical protein ACI9KS_001173 [Sulfitobacter sp.]
MHLVALALRDDARAALDTYADDPRHKVLGARLGSLCQTAQGSIMVFDLNTKGSI